MKNFLILSDAAGSLLNHLTTQFNFELGGDKKTVNLKACWYSCLSISSLKNYDPSTEMKRFQNVLQYHGEDILLWCEMLIC